MSTATKASVELKPLGMMEKLRSYVCGTKRAGGRRVLILLPFSPLTHAQTSLLDRLLISKQYFAEALIIFASINKFHFTNWPAFCRFVDNRTPSGSMFRRHVQMVSVSYFGDSRRVRTPGEKLGTTIHVVCSGVAEAIQHARQLAITGKLLRQCPRLLGLDILVSWHDNQRESLGVIEIHTRRCKDIGHCSPCPKWGSLFYYILRAHIDSGEASTLWPPCECCSWPKSRLSHVMHVKGHKSKGGKEAKRRTEGV